MSIIRLKFKINDMHCVSCAMNIDFYLEDLDGVKSAKTNYARSECEVEFDVEKIDQDKIIKEIKKAGYEAVLI